MYRLKRRGMWALKIVHLFGACCWLGGAVAMIMLNLYSGTAAREGMLYGINFSSHVVDMWVVITLGLGTCVFTGLLYGLLTPWGFFRQRWVAVKWIVTAVCFASGWLFLGRWEAALLAMSEAAGNRPAGGGVPAGARPPPRGLACAGGPAPLPRRHLGHQAVEAALTAAGRLPLLAAF